jgi:hypothetical protein
MANAALYFRRSRTAVGGTCGDPQEEPLSPSSTTTANPSAALAGGKQIGAIPPDYRFRLADYAIILKPNVMSLVVFTAQIGRAHV